ncbi:phospholipase [Shewanella sp. 10N.286.51.B7]|uniref:phospholipase D family protein n=1 Tax=Shewanella sp. 10N.286.51.B7 TaxID=1880836 RepID=UPI000C85BADC|nr:phospholipase D family protein [Shewanella sp. 10N.286.51.B7]PMG79530.1 phospholipase [Shewanella sp. 10N.286.51.B7]
MTLFKLNQHNSIWALLCGILLLSGCATPNPSVPDDFEANFQKRDYQAKAYIIPRANEAFAHRIELVRQAKSSIDMTYFSWNGDTLGLSLLNEISKAADRGVKVRLTLDDLLVFNDKWLADIDKHPNVQIRIFNPFNSRKMGWAGRAFDFQIHQQKLDNRLHEKYFNIDHQYMILGGRNIGDEYFGYSKAANFYDLDVLFSGDVIAPFATNYERQWHSEHLVPIAELIHVKKDINDTRYFKKAFNKATKKHAEIIADIEHTINTMPAAQWIDVTVSPVFDSLNKMENRLPYFRQRAEIAIQDELANAKEAVISTPYIVPTDGDFSVVSKLTKQGAKVQLVTNSSASNDSLFIPAYYEEHRKTLLDMGVDIFEYKDTAKNDDHFYHGDTYYHNKTIILDSRVSYIGSSNFDPRSDFINVEFGLFVHSAAFAEKLHHYLFAQQSSLYWQVSKNAEGEIEWQSQQEVLKSNPNYGSWHKLPDWLFKKMDGESEL